MRRPEDDFLTRKPTESDPFDHLDSMEPPDPAELEALVEKVAAALLDRKKAKPPEAPTSSEGQAPSDHAETEPPPRRGRRE